MTIYPLMLALEMAVGIVAGLLFRDDEFHEIRPRTLVAAALSSVAITLLLIAGRTLDILPFYLDIDSWYLLMSCTGIYEGAGFLLAALLLPWAPLRTRAKATLAILSGALLLGHLTYEGGHRVLRPDLTEYLTHFALAAVFAPGTATIGRTIRRLYSSAKVTRPGSSV